MIPMLIVHRPLFKQHGAKMNFVIKTEKLLFWNEIKSRPCVGRIGIEEIIFISPLSFPQPSYTLKCLKFIRISKNSSFPCSTNFVSGHPIPTPTFSFYKYLWCSNAYLKKN